MIKLKRAYEEPESGDGTRVLVERLWPRGVKKENLRLDAWAKDVAPSDALRRWFAHDPAKWDEFRKRYFAELDDRPDAVAEIAKQARRGTLTLIYSAHDTEHNNAIALKEYLQARTHVRAGGGRG